MNDLTTTSILSLFQTNKSERESFCLDVIDKIDSGNVDPLIIHLQVKCMEDILKLLNSNDTYRKSVLDACDNRGEKRFDFHNAKFEVKETGVKYDFSKCEDPILNDFLRQQEEIDKNVKDRQAFLKTVPAKGMSLLNEETGEMFIVYPPAKSSTTSVAVTLK